MGDKTKIEWTDATWNPVTGCTKVSQGCKHCYAERVFPRAYAKSGRKFTAVECHHERLDQPLRWKRGRKIFVNSMSDLFHEAVPFEFIDHVFAAMFDANQHAYQVLTKRPERMLEYLSADSSRYSARRVFDLTKSNAGKFDCDMYWPLGNVWLGVSIEDQQTADERIPLLLQTPAAVRFVSYEPALGPVDFEAWLEDGIPTDEQLSGPYGSKYVRRGAPRVDWIICGGESGPNACPMHPDWPRSVRNQCQAAGVPFFFKQWGEWAEVPRDETKPGWPRMVRGNDANVESSGHHEIFSVDDLSAVNEAMGLPMRRVGKVKAGSMLDGREHKEFPCSAI